jgi:hypothetical protein
MRALVVIASVTSLLAAACGGGSEPPAKSSADTSSLESGGASKDKEDAPAASAEPAATPAPAPAASTPAPAASAAPSDSAPAAGGSFHPAPSVTGDIDGKPFNPKVAQVLGPMKKDGRMLITVTEATDCPAAGDKGDHPTMTMLVPWQDGYKVDLASLKLGNKKGPAEIGFSRSKKDVSATFKPSGLVTVVSAPMEKGKTGKLKLDMQSGDFMLNGNLDIEICASPK